MAKLGDTTGGQWDEMANRYQKMATETSVKPISVMLDRANALLPFSEASGVLDNGCGPGPIMATLLKDYRVPDSAILTCADFSEGMVNIVEKRKREQVEQDSHSPWNRVETLVQNAMDLQKIQDGSRTHVAAGWVSDTSGHEHCTFH